MSRRANRSSILGSRAETGPVSYTHLPNMGEDYTQRFAAIFPSVAKKEHVELIPFLLEGVGGIPQYNQSDGIHPNATGHALIAKMLWPILRPHLLLKNSRPE